MHQHRSNTIILLVSPHRHAVSDATSPDLANLTQVDRAVSLLKRNMVKSLPIVDLSLASSPDTKPEFLRQLKDAFFKIGFLYLVNHGVEEKANKLLELSPGLFEVPQEEKDKIDMIKNPHFTGYTRLGVERTQKKLDLREQYDFGSATTTTYKKGDPEWKQIHGPTAYLPDNVYPGYQAAVQEYLDAMSDLSDRMLRLTAESLGLSPDEFDDFKGDMNRLKIIKYPPPPKDGSALQTSQGVGAHKDSSGMFTYIAQDKVGGLQVLDSEGDWIDAVPIENSFVVNIAQGFEALTSGRCQATTHRVVAPSDVTRYSIAYFQGIRLSLTLDEIRKEQDIINEKLPDLPEDLRRRERATASEFLDPRYSCFGEAHLRNRVISHRDVSEVWYPELNKKYVAELEKWTYQI